MPARTLETSVFLDGFVFLEGPRWHAGSLWVSDIWDHKVCRISGSGETEVVVAVPTRPSGLGFMPDGTLLLVSMTDRRLYCLRHGKLVLHADLSASVRADLNDMVVDPDGRAYVGNLGYDLFGGAEPANAEIILVEPDGSHRVVAEDLNFPNGLLLSDGGRTLVVAESFGHRLSAFDRDADGSLSNRRVYAELEGLVPDGICLDEGGNVWVAGAMGGEFVQVDRSGEVIARIDVRPRSAIACQLGGDDGCTLYCLTYAGGVEELSKGVPGARIETVRVEHAGAGSP